MLDQPLEGKGIHWLAANENRTKPTRIESHRIARNWTWFSALPAYLAHREWAQTKADRSHRPRFIGNELFAICPRGPGSTKPPIPSKRMPHSSLFAVPPACRRWPSSSVHLTDGRRHTNTALLLHGLGMVMVMVMGMGMGMVMWPPGQSSDRKMLQLKQTQTKEHSTYSLHILEHIKMRNCVAFDEAAAAATTQRRIPTTLEM